MNTSASYRQILPWIASGLILLVVAVYYGQFLPDGFLRHTDEYRTLDRANGFLVQQDWLTVYSENAPSFNKPPLQYWISGALLGLGWDIELATRLPAYLFALAGLVACGWFARLLLPQKPWIVPVAMLLLACSSLYWESAVSALLDSGSAFFVTVACASMLAALRDPRWSYGVALACGLAALQKTPIPLPFLLFLGVGIYAARDHRPALIRVFTSRHGQGSLILLIGLTAAWPLLQWARHGGGSLEAAYVDQMLVRFLPTGEAWDGKQNILKLMLGGEPIFRLLALLALLWLPWRLKRAELIGLPALLIIFGLVMTFATGIVSPRYVLVFLPIAMAALAATVFTYSQRPKIQAALVAILVVLGLGPIKPTSELDLYDDRTARQVPFLTAVGDQMRPPDTLLFCGQAKGADRMYRGAISYYASAGNPMARVGSLADLRALQDAGVLTPPYRWICGTEDSEKLQPALDAVAVYGAYGGFVHWSSLGARSD